MVSGRNSITTYFKEKARKLSSRLEATKETSDHQNTDSNCQDSPRIVLPAEHLAEQLQSQSLLSIDRSSLSNDTLTVSSNVYYSANGFVQSNELINARSPPGSPTTVDSSLWEASLCMKGLHGGGTAHVIERLSMKGGEVKLFSQEEEFLDIPDMNASIQKRIQRCVFQMYCATVQCTICLSNLCSSGEPDRYVVKAKLGSDKCPRLIFYINPQHMENQDNKENQDLFHIDAGDDSGMSIACLPCGHKYCDSCITSLIHHKAEAAHGGLDNAPAKMRIRCPLCRRKVKVTSVSYFKV